LVDKAAGRDDEHATVYPEISPGGSHQPMVRKSSRNSQVHEFAEAWIRPGGACFVRRRGRKSQSLRDPAAAVVSRPRGEGPESQGNAVDGLRIGAEMDSGPACSRADDSRRINP
jgi:hypothetical protein